MFKYYRKEIEWGGRPLILETGKIARQADGAVVITYGGTVVLCTAVGDKKVKPGQDFFPLTVHYQEKAFAVGKIPGGFFKREGRASEAETLNSRLIDRPIRPLFPENFTNEVQVIATVLSHDLENDPAIVALIGCSAALTLSGIPFLGPIAGCRVGYKDGEYILNPTLSEVKDSELDLVVAGTTEGVLMVESEAKELTEEVMLGAVNFGHQAGQVVIDAIIALAEHAARQPWDLIEPSAEEKKLKTRIDKVGRKLLAEAYKEKEKQKRYAALGEARAKILEKITEEELDAEKAPSLIDSLEADIVRTSVLKTGTRIDGRDLTTVRPIIGEVGILPATHGSALFTRGETQALVVTTLGTAQDEQIVDALEGEHRSNFMLHYNFPPYSVGECGRLGAPGRREIGHGKLAWRAIHPLLPSKEQFPYTMRVVSEITESNGSSSMATVCGTSLSLMDAGVPMERPVAGIAMGLIKEDKGVAVLTDILGDEDHLGDMDFKVAGTEQGITALQMDIKITSITPEIMKQALAQAKDGRMHILGEMAKALTESRSEISENAPHVIIMNIPKEKIRDLIGAGGKTIREIVEYAGCKIDIDDDGTVKIAVTSSEQEQKARERIEAIVVEPEVGRIYSGKVVKVADFGAFVNFMGARDGLVHISELAEGRVARTGDVVKVDDIVKVKVVGFDDRGKIKLSMREVDQETGADISETLPPRAPSPSRSRTDRPQRRS
ncbi:Polyribonucleotide nucleotidyltransferase (polynucleotide phosphorylase) (Pnp) (PDB:1E3P) [Commensalibacter communis]|uniref:Polyribonucleotide nucleotidyltransferase n=1 Tax=Commensalibacter communis TaxID=2972786 RepID=A0A9W4TMG1_9PROT|nr:polyribonucleotide nucleotidyltransferase [Commensalibacter communis]CAI3939046.1 Polyribonucleotide nucleotidyltransferase (polynucleotide phosphorylase) (Pnp) (PDB:1E3P) [Commensalibacter communis]CAI3939180.1 Polyribonucleotide nucleotidyltransferase (polynucleotide phosphorylase) (Pnp) (PDB:1E3P) [Commensalibacter communis]CAI3939230.1 Polyribonucleotide nucleotidyltransferase (polynucleotide phosphorylase) (Pnp) (PDB:1E3P) [Commensalibacter communis]CAI3941113.1 Polyribonucleotide nucle